MKMRRRGWIAGLAVGTSAAAIAAAIAMPGLTSKAATLQPTVQAKPAAVVQPAAAAGYTAPTRTLKVGLKGADVLALQHRLWGLHYWLKVTGTFDYDTQEAVYAFQAINKLKMDGVVGPLTGKALVTPHTYKPQDPTVATRIEVNINSGVQVLVYYKNNQLTLISHISSAGGYRFCDVHGCSIATTPTGWYHANRFIPGPVTVPLGQMENPVFFIGGSYAIHGDASVPNYPASHGCVRISDDLSLVFHTMIYIHQGTGTSIHIYNRSTT